MLRAMIRFTLLSVGLMVFFLNVTLLTARDSDAGAHWLIFTAKNDGVEQTFQTLGHNRTHPLAKTLSAQNPPPHVSPDRQWQLVTHERIDGTTFMMREHLNSRDQQAVVTFLALNVNPLWSPDGEWILFESFRDNQWDLFRVRPDGSSEQRVTATVARETNPRWSPDAAWIAYEAGEHDLRSVYRVRPDGSDRKRITPLGSQANHPAWSPDSAWLAVMGRESESQWDIFLIRADGSTFTRLTTDPNDDYFPMWSPDGQWIVYSSMSTRDLYRVRPDGSEEQRMTDMPGGVSFLGWTPPVNRAYSALLPAAAGLVLLAVGGWFPRHV